MKKEPEKVASDRRSFLKFAGLGTIAGGAALVSGEDVQAVEAPKITGSGYRESDHVKTFYDSARF